MKDYSKEFYNLNQFFGGYFNQDWKEFFDWNQLSPDFEVVVKHYKTEDTKEGVNKTTEELEKFLQLPLNDNELGEILSIQFDCSYTGKSLGLSKRQFLKRILEILTEPTGTKSPIVRKII